MVSRKDDWRQNSSRDTNDPVGIYLADLSACVPLTREEESSLVRDYRNALRTLKGRRNRRGEPGQDAARQAFKAEQRLMSGHLRLVVHIARHLYSRNPRQRLAFGDLICAGNLGLLEALRRFDPAKGNRLSTYAAWWIRNRMSAEIRQARWPVRIPDHAYKNVIRLEKTATAFLHQRNREPTLPELAQAVGQTEEWVGANMLWARSDVISLYTPVGDDGGAVLADIITDGKGALLEDEATARDVGGEASLAEAGDAIHELLSTLSPRDRMVLDLRFGLEERYGRTRGEVGCELRLTAERIRQIEVAALQSLRAKIAKRRGLREWLLEAYES